MRGIKQDMGNCFVRKLRRDPKNTLPNREVSIVLILLRAFLYGSPQLAKSLIPTLKIEYYHSLELLEARF